MVVMIGLAAMIGAGAMIAHDVRRAQASAASYLFEQGVDQNLDAAFDAAATALMAAGSAGDGQGTGRNRSRAAYRASVVEPDSATGLPAALVELTPPVWRNGVPRVTHWPGEQLDPVNHQVRRYLVERLCLRPGPIEEARCSRDPKTGSPYFRITIRVDGPAGQVRYAQGLVSMPVPAGADGMLARVVLHGVRLIDPSRRMS